MCHQAFSNDILDAVSLVSTIQTFQALKRDAELRLKDFTQPLAIKIGFCLLFVLFGCKKDVQQVLPNERIVAIQAPREPEKDAQTLLNEAGQSLQAGDIDSASKAIRTALAIEPDNPQLRFTLAIVLGQEHRYPEAVMMLDELAEAVPETRLPALGQTAEWLVVQGDWAQAEARYKTVLEEIPDVAMAHRQLSQLLVRQGRQLEAAKHLHSLCQQGNIEEVELRTLLCLESPFAADAARAELEPIGPLGKARSAIGNGNWEDAATILLSEKTLAPVEAALLGRIHAEQSDFAKLEVWANSLSKSDSETADGWFARAVLASHQGDHRLAVKHLCETVLKDPTDERAFAKLAKSLQHLGATAEARQATERAKWLARTRTIGNQMAASSERNLNTLAELAELLEQLHRPLESLSWQAVRIAYGRSILPKEEQQSQLVEINSRRLQLIASTQPAATEQFILCGVDPDAIAPPKVSSE